MKYDLNRFKTAQKSCYYQVLDEIRKGKKESHWMWYIFPQIIGLGKSRTAKKYEIANIEEAEYFLMDEMLSKRLLELTRILTYEIEDKTAEEIFGFPDFLKFHSCMTLFYCVVISNRKFENNPDYFCFEHAIKKYYLGQLDKLTMDIINNKTLFSKETPYQFTTLYVDNEEFEYRIEYVNIQTDQFNVPVGNLKIQNNVLENLALIEKAMGPLCWSADKKIIVLPILYIHWLKGFHQKFVSINFDKKEITYFKKLHPGGPRVIDRIENNCFYFKYFNRKMNKVIEEFGSLIIDEIDKNIRF